MDGAVERVRPKMMTVTAIMAGLLPILWSEGTGSEVMRRIAVPMVGGMVSSTLLTLLVIPGDLWSGEGRRADERSQAACPRRREQAAGRNLAAGRTLGPHPWRSLERRLPMSTLLIIIILLILFGGGGGYYAHRSYGGRGLGGVLGLVIIIILILWLLGVFATGVPVR